MDESTIVKENYDSDPLREWNRLEGFHYEFEITSKIMSRYMKKGKILDIGGGPGRYSIHLAKMGYDVTLADLSDGNVALAKEMADKEGVRIEAFQADARDLSALHLDEYDYVLLMGPLYHLFKESDRKKCVEETKKHLKKDGLIYASFISVSAGINYYLDENPDALIDDPAQDLFDRMTENQSWSGTAFTEATFINNLEILPFFEQLGFKKLTLFGQEGICGTRLSHLESACESVRKRYLEISLDLCENPQYFAYSNHMMYVGKYI